MITIYVLKLEKGRYYIGRTDKEEPKDRILQHFFSHGSEFTKKFKPEEILYIIPNCDEFDEDKITKQNMSIHGIEFVRGGSYSMLDLSEEEIELINKEILSAKNLCFNCKGKHRIMNCTNPCGRCGFDHLRVNCFAKKNKKGELISKYKV